MTVSSVLVVGGDPAGCAVARALAAGDIEVSLIAPAGCADADGLRRAGVEVRTQGGLVGLVDVDSHVEAELSHGAVENHDIVVLADPPTRAAFDPASRRVILIADEADATGVAERGLTGYPLEPADGL